ncbi:MAG: hypothetical protein M3Q22_00700 [Actinomycetota bacterium]|nr:hypothetical protein [Actinomycetota bacterium]
MTRVRGKTTLLLELRRRLLTRDDAPQLGYGRALGASGKDSAWQPVREALRDLMEKDEPEGSGRMGRAAVVKVLRQSAPAWLGVIPVVGPVVSAVASTTDAAVAAMHGQQRDRRSTPPGVDEPAVLQSGRPSGE